MAAKAALPSFTKIDVIEVGGKYCSLNNGILYCLKKAAGREKVSVNVRVHRFSAPLLAKFMHAWTTQNQGQRIRLRRSLDSGAGRVCQRADKRQNVGLH